MRISQVKFGARLGIGFAIMVLMLGVLAAVGLASMLVIKAELNEVATVNNQEMRLNNELAEQVHVFSRIIPTLNLLDDEDQRKAESAKLTAARARYDTVWKALQEFPPSEDARPLAAGIETAWRAARVVNFQVIADAMGDIRSEARALLVEKGIARNAAWIDAINANIAHEAQVSAAGRLGRLGPHRLRHAPDQPRPRMCAAHGRRRPHRARGTPHRLLRQGRDLAADIRHAHHARQHLRNGDERAGKRRQRGHRGTADLEGQSRPVRPHRKAGRQPGADGGGDGSTHRHRARQQRQHRAGGSAGRRRRRCGRARWRGDARSDGHHERHRPEQQEDRQHHRHQRRHRFPDQHPGAERRRGSGARRRTGPRLRHGGRRSAQPGPALGCRCARDQGIDRQLRGAGGRRQCAGGAGRQR